jgi:hypothetical protein
MIYMKILKKGGVVEKRGEEETKSMPHSPVFVAIERSHTHTLQVNTTLNFVAIERSHTQTHTLSSKHDV